MLNVTKELTALARKLGYTGKAPDTVAKAINAITSVADSSGGGSEVFLIENEMVTDTVTLKKTWKEIKDEFISGKSCIVIDSSANAALVTVVCDNIDIPGGSYIVCVNTVNGINSFTTDSENGYPSFTIGG